jgi:hypothetical protein
VVFADGWTCPVCWKSNRAQDPACYRCKTPRGLDEAQVEAQRKVHEARAEQPEVVPDLVVALPVVIFRSYARVWRRGGMGALAVPALMLFGGVTDPGWLLATFALAAGLIACGFAAGEVVDGMRGREVWAFAMGIVLSVIGLVGSIFAFQVLAPGLIHPTAVRWGSVIVFGGAGLAALGGLVLLFVRRPSQPR